MSKQKNLYQILATIQDPRRAQGRRHQLPFVLIIIIMALMSGAQSLYAIEDFAQRHQAFLYKLFSLEDKQRRVPGRKTFERLLAVLPFQQLGDVFLKWAQAYVPIKAGDWIAMDGKAIGGTVTNANNEFQNFSSLVSVFAQKRRQILAQQRFENKQRSEIAVVQELIECLDLEGVVFSFDALHCQKKTTELIVKSGNDYVIGVKGNQKKLYEAVKKKSKAKSRRIPSKAKQ